MTDNVYDNCDNLTLFHTFFRMFFANIIGLPEHRNKRKSVLEITKMYYFVNSNYKIIEQEMNKIAIHTHVIFRPRNARVVNIVCHGHKCNVLYIRFNDSIIDKYVTLFFRPQLCLAVYRHRRLGSSPTCVRPGGMCHAEDAVHRRESQASQGRYMALQEAVRGHPQNGTAVMGLLLLLNTGTGLSLNSWLERSLMVR